MTMTGEAKHSPEPWRDDSSYIPVGAWGWVVDASGELLMGDGCYLSPATRRRIVACVNACAGIPTEALEAGALAKALESLSELVARRKRACEDNRAEAALRALGVLKP